MLLNFTDFGPNKYDTSIQLKCCNYITVILLRRRPQRMLKRKLSHNFDWRQFLEPRTSFCFVFCKKLTNPSFLLLSIQHQMASRFKKRLILGFSHKNKFWLDYFFAGAGAASNEQTLDNLCGDLNKGYLPLNPTGQNVEGVSYPLWVKKPKVAF